MLYEFFMNLDYFFLLTYDIHNSTNFDVCYSAIKISAIPVEIRLDFFKMRVIWRCV